MPQAQSRNKAHEAEAHEAESIIEAVQDGAQSVRDAGTHIYNTALDRTRRASRQAAGYVREKPWHSLGVAAAAGFVLGYLFARRG